MRTFVHIIFILILFYLEVYAQNVNTKNFKQLDAEWRSGESSQKNEFRIRDRQWLKRDTEDKGWRRDDSIWRQKDSESDSEWRKRNSAWIKEDNR